jgi:Rrf2 family iron-sulfur cluster assembly transcriptional regulator
MVEFPEFGQFAKAGGRPVGQGLAGGRQAQRQAGHFSHAVVKPMRVNAPNSVFALGNAFSKN